ncbi:MAG: hypothetical protein HYS07_06490 [Chlamydiae bacterium]|nr:hypothetical protein [Chlamydiota bacterium]
MLFKSFQRAVRIFLCIYFITYDISIGYAQDSPILGPLAVSSLGGIPLQNQPVETKALLESIKIPSDVGEIIDQNIISERPLLFILEDIHCNTEVEGNEEKILRALEAEIKDAGKLGSWEAKKQKVSPSFLASQLPSQPFYVFSEAASGPIDMSFFTAFPDQKALAEAQKKFLMNHDINSLESFLISEGDKVKGWGVEDVRTYVDNARAMGALMEERELQEPVWADLDETIKNLRLKIYPKELWELMEKREKYREYKIGVGEYVNQISKIKDQNDRSKIRNDQFVIASEAKQSQLYLYPSIEKFLELQTLEKKTDASKIESEYLKFLSKLEKKLPKEELNEVLKNVLEYRLGRVSDEEHYLFLSKYLEPEDGESFSPLKLRGEGGVMEENNNPSDSPYGFRLSASTTSSFTHKWVPELGRLKGREKQEEKELYPNLKLFIQQMSLMKQISWEKLDEEIEKREEDMIEELAITDQAKQLIELEKNYDVLKRVVSMEGNREDLKVVWSSPLHTIPPLKVRGAWGVTPLKGPGELGVRGVMKEEEVTPSIPLKKIRGRKNLQGEEEYIEKFSQALKKLCEKNNLSFESPDFGDIFKIAEKFYEKVLERDPIMYEKTVKLLEQRKLKYAAIIMGGFHTEGFRERLKAANIGYCVISPRMNKMDDRSGYFRKIKEFDDLLENPINTSFSDIMKNLAKEMLKDAHLTDSDFEKWKNRATHFSNIIQDLTLQYSQTGQWIRDPTQMNFINQLRKLLARGGTAARLTQSYLKKALGEDDQDFVTFLESDASSNPKNQKQSHSAFANQFMPPTVTNMLPQALALEVGQEPGDQLGTTLDITHMRGPVLHQAGTITVTGEGLPAEVVECVLSLKKRLANATRELWEAVPTLDRMELNLVTREFNQRYPELFKEATEYFGTEWQVADFLVLLAKPIQNAESYTNPEVLEELLERLKTKNGRWIIAIDGANGSGKTTFWSSIRSKNNVLGELSEEMAFVEGEKQLWDLHQQVTHDTELPFDVAYGIEHDPTVVQSWVDKMLKKHGRFMRDLGFLGGPDRQRETINLILRYPKDIDGFRKAFLESVEDRIIVYNANGSHDYVDKQLASDTEFPTTRVAKVKVIANSDRTRRLEISYKIVGQALDDLERRLVEQDGATTGASVPSSDDPLGRCVTADTMLPIVRKLGAKSFGLGEKEETPIVIPQLIPIVQVRPDDYVFSLNEETGKLEPHRIVGLMDMGVKPVFKLTTASGRSIRTTANHPYLKKVEGNEKQVEGGSSKVEGKDKNTFIPSTLDLRASASLFPSTFSLPALTYSHWTPVSQLHVGDKIAVPSRKFFLRAQGIERGKMTGDGCVQQPRSDVGTNEDGIELSQLKGSCEDNRIGSGEVMSHNKIVRRKDLSFSDVPDSNSLVRNVFGESSQSHSSAKSTFIFLRRW